MENKKVSVMRYKRWLKREDTCYLYHSLKICKKDKLDVLWEVLGDAQAAIYERSLHKGSYSDTRLCYVVEGNLFQQKEARGNNSGQVESPLWCHITKQNFSKV